MGKHKNKQHVILLHGLGRSWLSMWWLSHALRKAGFQVHNTNYPSTRHTIQRLSEAYIKPVVMRLPRETPIHFVTHSLGGILVRQYLQDNTLPAGSRIVMLAPPNRGSEVADHLKDWKVFQWMDGPAGQQLGTGQQSTPRQLKPISNEVGIIAGTNQRLLPTSYWIPGDSDGLVSVDSTQLDEMRDFLLVDCGHTMIMNNPEVIRQVIHFLGHGSFQHDT